MILLIDIGNSRVKWARYDGAALFGHGTVAYAEETLAERLGASWSGVPPPERVVACNVGGPRVAGTMVSWVRRSWSIGVEFAAAQASALGVTNAYAEPGQLGVDRWMALIAARRKFHGPVCVIDCGTAITLDVLATDGRHLGGMIIPGLALMRRSLLDHTQGICDAFARGSSALAHTTGDAVATGTSLAAVSLVERVVGDVERDLGAGVQCVITGGDLESLRARLGRRCVVETDLVLQGLAMVAESRR